MSTKRKIEIFSAGCPACEETVELVKSIACSSCEISILDIHDSDVASRAKRLGIHSVPAVVIDNKLADCCTHRGPDEAVLKSSRHWAIDLAVKIILPATASDSLGSEAFSLLLSTPPKDIPHPLEHSRSRFFYALETIRPTE